MDAGIFLKLVSPGISSVLGATFLLLWFNQRRRRYLLVLAFAYFCSALGFVLQQFDLPIGFEASKFASNLCFAIGTMCIAGAIISGTGRRVPIFSLSLLGAGGLAAFSWFLFVQPNFTWRIFSMNFALGGVALLVAAELRAIAEKSPVEKVLLALALICSLNFLLRPILIVQFQGPYLSYDGFYHSVFWTTLVLSHALLSLLVGLSVIGVLAMDNLKALRSESHTDPLSGLLNRRGFEEAANKGLGRSRSQGRSAALIVADLDHFKQVNDTFGHPVGDRVIVAFADLLRTSAQSKGIAGRIGGEEFAIFLPSSDLDEARHIAEIIRATFAASAYPDVPRGALLRASFGVAASIGNEALERLFSRADDALYQAKKGGRDSMHISCERSPEPSLPKPLPAVA